jgi:predicted GNAT family acetyltransferase
MDTEEVTNNERESQYELSTEAGLAVLEYMREGDRIALVHTEVPKALEGRGLGAKLVKFALADARARDLQVLPMCAFVRAYVAKHPEYAPLVAKR